MYRFCINKLVSIVLCSLFLHCRSYTTRQTQLPEASPVGDEFDDDDDFNIEEEEEYFLDDSSADELVVEDSGQDAKDGNKTNTPADDVDAEEDEDEEDDEEDFINYVGDTLDIIAEPAHPKEEVKPESENTLSGIPEEDKDVDLDEDDDIPPEDLDESKDESLMEEQSEAPDVELEDFLKDFDDEDFLEDVDFDWDDVFDEDAPIGDIDWRDTDIPQDMDMSEEEYEEYMKEMEELQTEWEQYMTDFEPKDILTFEINPTSSFVFHEQIHSPKSYIRGAFVTTLQTGSIDFEIFSQTGEQVFTRKNKKEGIFHFFATELGTYDFKFSNHHLLDTKEVTFVVHCGNSTAPLLEAQELDPFEKKLKHIETGVNEFIIEQRFYNKRQQYHLDNLLEINQKNLISAVFEAISVILVTLWQIFYIKKMLDFERVL